MNPAQPRLPSRKPTIERITLVGEEIAAVPKWWWDIVSARCRDSRGS
jgi:hypothetical protein